MSAVRASGFFPSLVRTAVPYAVSTVAAFAARVGLDLPEEVLAEWALACVVFAGGTLYYAASRLVERYLSPLWGALMLGSRSIPSYASTTEPELEPEPVVGSCGPERDCRDQEG